MTSGHYTRTFPGIPGGSLTERIELCLPFSLDSCQRLVSLSEAKICANSILRLSRLEWGSRELPAAHITEI